MQINALSISHNEEGILYAQLGGQASWVGNQAGCQDHQLFMSNHAGGAGGIIICHVII